MGAARFGISRRRAAAADDIEILVAEARKPGFYTNLIHLRRGPHRARLAALKGGRARPHPGSRSGTPPVSHRPRHSPHPHLRPQSARSPTSCRPPATPNGDQLRAPPGQHRLTWTCHQRWPPRSARSSSEPSPPGTTGPGTSTAPRRDAHRGPTGRGRGVSPNAGAK